MRVELFELHPSKTYIYLLSILHLGAACCVFLSKIPIVFMIIFTSVIGINFIFQLKEHLSIKKITLSKQKQKTPLVCTPWVVGLTVAKKSHIIFFDSMSVQMFRHLRVLLINRGVRNEN